MTSSRTFDLISVKFGKGPRGGEGGLKGGGGWS